MAKKPVKSVKQDKQDDKSTFKALLDAKFGEGTIMKGRGSIVDVDVVPTNIAAIDIALGVGGLPLGRVIELFGNESSGKTTACLNFIAAFQRYYFPAKERNGIAAFVDAEHAFDPTWAELNGVNMEELYVTQPSNGEEALSIVEVIAKSGEVDLVIVDSVAALVPKAELDGEIGDHHIGAQARMMSQAMRKLTSIASKSGTTIIFINQVREKIGVSFGNPETTPGGKALKFYASIRINIFKGSAVKIGDVTVAFRPTMKIIKNKVAPPFTTAVFDICVGRPERPVYGIDGMASLCEVGEKYKIITRRGSSYSYNNQVLGNGLGRSSTFLNENKDIADEIRRKIYDVALGKPIIQPDQDLDAISNEVISDDD